jgi:hypothetical protein
MVLTEDLAFCQKMPLEKLITVAKRLTKCGYRPIRVRPYQVGIFVEAAAIWTRDGRAWEIASGLGREDLVKRDEVLQRKDYIVEDVASYSDKELSFAAIWVVDNAKSGGSRLLLGAESAKHQAAFESFVSEGYIPYTIQAMSSERGLFFSQVYRKAHLDSWVQRIGHSECDFAIFASGDLLRNASLLKEATGGLTFAAIRQARKGVASIEVHCTDHDEHLARCLALIDKDTDLYRFPCNSRPSPSIRK